MPKKATKDAETAVEEDTGPAVRLMNQEEYVQPVDGGDVEKVEEDEHPEVMEAVKEQTKSRKRVARKKKGEIAS